MKISSKKKKELEEYTTHWLAYYNHMDIFDGPVPMNTARLLVEASIDDKLRKQAEDLVNNILKRLPKLTSEDR